MATIRKSPIRPLYFLLPAAILLLGVAVYRGVTPILLERRLQSATYAQLVEVVKSDPGNARVFLHFGERLRDLGRTGPARAALAHASDLDPDSRDICLARAALAIETGNTNEAFATYQSFLKNHPNDADVHQALAFFYSANDAPRYTFREAQILTRLRPTDAATWRLMGTAALVMNSTSPNNEAEAPMRQAATLAPGDWHNQYGVGEALHQQRRDRDALPFYAKAAALAPQENVVIVALGRAQLAVASSPAALREAAETLKRATNLAGNSPLTWLALGDVCRRLRDYAASESALKNAERLAPQQSDVHFALIRLYQQMNRRAEVAREKALLAQTEAYRAEKQRLIGRLQGVGYNSDEALRLARLTAAHDDYPEAVRQYHRLLADPIQAPVARRELAALEARMPRPDPPSHVPTPVIPNPQDKPLMAALLADGDSFRAKSDYVSAENAYRAVLRRDPRSGAAWEGVGLSLYEQKRTGDAFRALVQAAELNPKLPETQFTLAQIYYTKSFPDEARKRLEILVKQVPGDARYWNLLGDCCRAFKDLQPRAAEAYEHAVQIKNDEPEYLANLADIESALAKPDLAESHYRAALRIAPGDPQAKLSLGTFLVEERGTPAARAEALPLLRASITAEPQNADAQFVLGKLLLANGDAAGAILPLQISVWQNPRLANAWYILGHADERLGKTTEAQNAYQMFRRISENTKNRLSLEDDVHDRPQSLPLRLHLARLYREADVPTKALNQYQQAAKLAPQNIALRRELSEYIALLKSQKRLPDTSFFNALVEQSVSARKN